MTREWDARIRGERPIVPEEMNVSGSQALCSIVQHQTPKFTQLECNEAKYYLKNYLCRDPTEAEIDQYLKVGSVGTPETVEKKDLANPGITQSVEFTNMDGLEKVHKSNDVVFFDSLCELSDPSKSYQQYIEHVVKPKPVYIYNNETCRYDLVSPVKDLTSAYITGYSASRCKETDNIVYIPKYDAGQYSPYSKAVSVRSSANRLSSQICKLPEKTGINDLYLMGMDLTFPKDISLLMLKDQKTTLDLVDKAVKVYVKTLISETTWIRKKGQKLGYFYNVHTWHTHHAGDIKEISTPDEPHLHVHFNIINMTVRDKEYIRFNPNIERALVEKCWSFAIFKAFAYSIPDPVFYLQYIPLTSRARVSHRIRYCGRSQLNDLFDYYQDNDFKADIPLEFNKFLVDYNNRRHPFGYIRTIKALVGDVDGERVCGICASPSEKLDPLTPAEMERKVNAEMIPVAIYRSKSRIVSIIKRVCINPDYANEAIS